MPTDFTTECGALQLSLMQMLAATIVGYDDIAGVRHYRMNQLAVSGDCDDLHPLVDCDTNHIEWERRLVENVFALDVCDRLALKVFANSSDPEDYSTPCGELPQKFFDMLNRCIVGYYDIAGVLHYRINTITATAACDTITPLLDCNTNNIESERLLVENVFALDECGNYALKIFTNSGTQRDGTAEDYTTACLELAQSLIQMFARTIILYNGHYYINALNVTGYCDDLHDFWTCSNNHIDPERALVENLFSLDACGNLAIKSFTNNGHELQ